MCSHRYIYVCVYTCAYTCYIYAYFKNYVCIVFTHKIEINISADQKQNLPAKY